ncbi:uncharacterized protein PV07_06401 [Cladophialophora immunda]|uniref:SnoaL-like domain-containing protein n=1 Tax=Cladophialophora immunda TaxID=569365 RepID=A0A0D1ZRK8_9EURO|nr:uncharacterized protein PV07_06401 [Cladophialophora immunda]KIW30681.1 hypothetical protein PV07_06401 [Cladophialophora immunda]OQU99484.1 hypothetical protein CLAIMM_05115 [Cladophialophora immunda]
MASIQRRTAIAFLDTFKDLDLESNLALRTPDCVHTIAPATLNMKPSMSNEQFAAHLLSLKEKISAIPVTPKEIFEGGNLVTIWATSKTTFREEGKDEDLTVDWSYDGEYIFVFTFNQAGDKIQYILEFLDSKKVDKARGLLERAGGNLAARKENK